MKVLLANLIPFLFPLQPTASKKKGGAKSCSGDEILPSNMRKVTGTTAFFPRWSSHEEQNAPLIVIIPRDLLWNDVCAQPPYMCSFPTQGKATRKPPTTSKRAKALAASMQNSSIRRWGFYSGTASPRAAGWRQTNFCLWRFRSSRKMMVTPARSMLDASLMMGPTPLITPRFDPRWAGLLAVVAWPPRYRRSSPPSRTRMIHSL